jgi:hypothetical protein
VWKCFSGALITVNLTDELTNEQSRTIVVGGAHDMEIVTQYHAVNQQNTTLLIVCTKLGCTVGE